jgi:hypothetical protein
MYCECGCGGITTQYDRNWFCKGIQKGDYHRFIAGHANHLRRAENAYQWNGGIRVGSDGYVLAYCPDHPRDLRNKRFVREHILVVEKALRHYLPLSAQVHHFDENRQNNNNNNLVVCEDKAYHFLLHRRAKALRECGHVSWQKCIYCHQWDDPINFRYSPAKHYHGKYLHPECLRAYSNARYALKHPKTDQNNE